MKNTFFDRVRLILEEVDLNKEFKYTDKTICIIPGSFKPPHKGHFEMILDCVKQAELVFVFISNTSEKHIAARWISKSNLIKFAKIISKFQLSPKVQNLYNKLVENAEEITFNDLIDFVNNVKTISNDEKLNEELTKFIESTKATLFKSIRRTSTGTEITPEIAKEIFEIFIKAYGLENKVFIEISKSSSPMTEAIGFANNECKDCTIYLGRSTKNDDFSAINTLLKSFEDNPTNTIVPFPIEVKTNISATNLRENITNLNKEMFPEKISEDDFKKIQSLLN